MPGIMNLVVARTLAAMVQHPPCQLRAGKGTRATRSGGGPGWHPTPAWTGGLEVTDVPSLPT